MEIKTLKDLKEAMKDIPDEVLDQFGAGTYEDEFVQLLCWEEGEEGDSSEQFRKLEKKYPILKDIGKWIENIAKVQDQFTTHEEYITDEAISSKDKIEIKPKKV